MTKTELKEAHERFKLKSKMIKELTYNSIITESIDDQEIRIRYLLKPENYTEFFDYYFGIGVSFSLADAPCADFHQSSYEKLYNDPFIVQQRRWYRGAAKSIHSNVGNICHLKQNNELFFGLIIGRNERMAKVLLSDLQTHLQFNERFIKDFGNQFSYGSWADGQFLTTDNKIFMALGLNQPFRGLRNGANRVDYASVDDCEDRKQAKNKELVQENVEKITGDLVKAYHLKRGRTNISNNYIVKEGLLDGIADKFKNSGHLDIDTVNLADKNNNPSWHQRLTKEDVLIINQKTDYYTSQREDYNNPIEEGKLFKKEWIRFEKIEDNALFSGVISHWDLSYTKNGDYKACVILGVKNGKFYILDSFCRQCELPEALGWHYDKMREYAEKGISILSYYDASVAQRAVFEPAWLAAAEREKYYSIPLPSHANMDKHLRIEATLTDVFFNHLLVVDRRLKDSDDWQNSEYQILSFEKGTKANDDFPDTLECAVRLGRLHFGYSPTGQSSSPLIVKRNRRNIY